MEYEMGLISEEELEANQPEEDDICSARLHDYTADPETEDLLIDASEWQVTRGGSEVCAVSVKGMSEYALELTLQSDLSPLAQLPVSIYYDNQLHRTISIQGTQGKTVTETVDMGFVFGSNHYLKFYFGSDGLNILNIRLHRV